MTFFVVTEWKPICMNKNFSDFDVHVHSVGTTTCFVFALRTSRDSLNSSP